MNLDTCLGSRMKKEIGMVVTKDRMLFLETTANNLTTKLEAAVNRIHANTDDTTKDEYLAQLELLRTIADEALSSNCYDVRKSTLCNNMFTSAQTKFSRYDLAEITIPDIKSLFIAFLKATVFMQQQILSDYDRVSQFVTRAEKICRDPQKYYDEVTADLEEPDTLDH